MLRNTRKILHLSLKSLLPVFSFTPPTILCPSLLPSVCCCVPLSTRESTGNHRSFSEASVWTSIVRHTQYLPLSLRPTLLKLVTQSKIHLKYSSARGLSHRVAARKLACRSSRLRHPSIFEDLPYWNVPNSLKVRHVPNVNPARVLPWLYLADSHHCSNGSQP